MPARLGATSGVPIGAPSAPSACTAMCSSAALVPRYQASRAPAPDSEATVGTEPPVAPVVTVWSVAVASSPRWKT